MSRELTPDERVTVVRAIQLVRLTGFREKAALLDDMLQDGDFEVDPDLDSAGSDARAVKVVLWPFGVRLAEQLKLNPKALEGGQPHPWQAWDPRTAGLAAALVQEADHILCDDELSAWGDMYVFWVELNKRFDEIYVPPLLPAGFDRSKFKEAFDQIKLLEKRHILEQRDKIARRGGRGYGNEPKKVEDARRAILEEIRSAKAPFGIGEVPVVLERQSYAPPAKSRDFEARAAELRELFGRD